MKASKLIEQLQAVMKEHGDLDVFFPSYEDGDVKDEDVFGITVSMRLDDTAGGFLICDKEIFLAFAD